MKTQKQLFQHVSFTTEEMNGLYDGGVHTYPVELSLDDCKAKYLASRYMQSIKGYMRPEPKRLVSAEMIFVG